MTVLHLDIETYSEINLKTDGLDRYSAHPSFEILMCGWRIDNGPVGVWFPHEGLPYDVKETILDPAVPKKAWNAQFERICFKRDKRFNWDIPIEQWRCSMVGALMRALPDSLDHCGRIIGLGEDFAKKPGKNYINLFCKPHEHTKHHPFNRYDQFTHPLEWAEFVEYCRRDVVAESKIDHVLEKFPVQERMWRLYAIDQKINEKGMFIDLQFVENALRFVRKHKQECLNKLDDLTGLKNSNSVSQLVPWLRDQGYPFESIAVARMDRALEDFSSTMSERCLEALRLRQMIAQTSVIKLDQILHRVGYDGRLRFQFQMAGAGRTGRFAGRGTQPHNYPRPAKEHEPFLAAIRQYIKEDDYDAVAMLFDDVTWAVSSCTRAAIAAPPGKVLRVADLSSAETRTAGWIANCAAINKIFKDKRDPYKAFAMMMWRIAYEEVQKWQRQIAKPAVLGGVYRLSGGMEKGEYPDIEKTGLWGYAENMGVKMTREQATDAIALLREEWFEVKEKWYELENAMMQILDDPDKKPVECWPVEFSAQPPFLRMKLPSGRYIYYLRPKVRENKIEKADGTHYFKRGVSYEGRDKTQKWGRLNTHGGRTFEQCLSASSKVLTPSGPKCIIDVSDNDMVWDGESWVRHGGLVDRGARQTIQWPGIEITEDHLVDVDGSWMRVEETSYEEAASSFSRHFRRPTTYADGGSLCRIERIEVSVADPLRLRQRVSDACFRIQEGAYKILRLCEVEVSQRIKHPTRYVASSGLYLLALDDGALLQPQAQGVPPLWRSWDSNLQKMAGVVREFLDGCFAHLRIRSRHRTDQQQRQLQTGECALGDVERTDTQYSGEPRDRYAEGTNADLRSGRVERNRKYNSAVSRRARMAGAGYVPSTSVFQQVFDLKEAGPHHRFCVVGSDGRLVLVHNCDQAISTADCLFEWMFATDAEDFNLVFHAHDELVSEEDVDDTVHTVERMCELAARPIPYLPGLDLTAEGFETTWYRKV